MFAKKNIFLLIFLTHKFFQRCKMLIHKILLLGVYGCLEYHHVKFTPTKLSIVGFPIINIGKNCKVEIGEHVHIVSGMNNGIDNSICSKINVKDDAKLIIGNNTGMTNVVIQCHQNISIGNYVNIGAGCMIFDTDFHSLSWKDRVDGTDISMRKKKQVVIKDYAFIGAHSIILKGVTIGEKSIVGAGSIVSKNIPDGEIWAGNPARFIKKIQE